METHWYDIVDVILLLTTIVWWTCNYIVHFNSCIGLHASESQLLAFNACSHTLQTILDVARQMKQDSGDDNKPLNMTRAAPDSLSFCANCEVADHNMFFLQSFIL